MNREVVISQFKRYVEDFAAVDEGVSLKLAHSLRVSSLCEILARSLQLSRDEQNLAWLIGVLHDIGRFEQLRQYHTFIDYQSMDHAKYGARYLFQEGHIRDFLQDDCEDPVIEAAIAQHNAYQLSDDLLPRQRLFCQILRDADKIDIFRVCAEGLRRGQNVWRVDDKDFEKQGISDAVMAEARQKKLVQTRVKKTFMDFYVGTLCFYFDLVYDESRKLAKDQGYFSELLNFHSQNADSEAKLNEIRRLIQGD
ncbi:HD domain-containing protein [uncultured Megasphaera sp.]|uniref:HD domain-containing protein n=1 Tax=uncultured Megasphaera sp. TaxID=165188 RepID=UPI0026014F4E|nr:HD domain-containing protein [uncultured Megasphaera sp.]